MNTYVFDFHRDADPKIVPRCVGYTPRDAAMRFMSKNGLSISEMRGLRLAHRPGVLLADRYNFTVACPCPLVRVF